MEEWELIFTHFVWLWSKGLYSCLTTWVTHFPYLSYYPVGCGVPFTERHLVCDT